MYTVRLNYRHATSTNLQRDNLLYSCSYTAMKRAHGGPIGGSGNCGEEGGGGGGGGEEGERKKMRISESSESVNDQWLIMLIALWCSSTLAGPNWCFEEVCRVWLEVMRNFRS